MAWSPRPVGMVQCNDAAKESAVIPYQVDPSLHAAPPAPAQLDDGFAPPPERAPAQQDEPLAAGLGLGAEQSAF